MFINPLKAKQILYIQICKCGKSFQFCVAIYLRAALISKLNEKRTVKPCSPEELCKMLLKSSLCLSFFSYHNLKILYVYQLSFNTLLLSVLDFLDPQFQEIKSFFVRTVASSLHEM